MLFKLTLLVLPLLLTTLYALSLHHSHPQNLKPKIFVLGLSKTGTTSVGNALAQLGYKRLGWKTIRSAHLCHTYAHGDLSALVEQTRYFDAFEDLPWGFVYEEMAAMYPDAKFVLTVRREEEVWARSWRRHFGRGRWGMAGFFYGADGQVWDEWVRELVVGRYRRHAEEVRRFFADKPGRFTELVIEDGDANWEVLCRVAECPGGRVPKVAFPKSNTVEHWKDGSFWGEVNRLWGYLLSTAEDRLERIYYVEQWPVVTRALEMVWRYVSVVELAICQLYFKWVVQPQQLQMGD